MKLPGLRSSQAAMTTIEVRTELLSHITGIPYDVLSQREGFSTLELTWTDHARLLIRLAELPAPKPQPRHRRRKAN